MSSYQRLHSRRESGVFVLHHQHISSLICLDDLLRVYFSCRANVQQTTKIHIFGKGVQQFTKHLCYCERGFDVKVCVRKTADTTGHAACIRFHGLGGDFFFNKHMLYSILGLRKSHKVTSKTKHTTHRESLKVPGRVVTAIKHNGFPTDQ